MVEAERIGLGNAYFIIFLAPYAKAGLEKIAGAVTERLGTQMADYAGELTSKVWSLITTAFSSPKEQHTIELFRENPDEMQALLIKQLHAKLVQDPTFTQTLAELINQPGPDGVTTGAQIMHAGIAGIADLRGANLSQAQDMVIGGVVMGEQPDAKPSL